MAEFPYNYTSNLPLGWEEKVSPEGRVFYLDHNTKTSQWNHPVTGRRKRVVAGLPPGWEELHGESDKPKFIHKTKNIITYIDPRLPYILEDKEYEEDKKQDALISKTLSTFKKTVETPEFGNPFTTNPFSGSSQKTLPSGQMGRFDAPFPRHPPNYGDVSRGRSFRSYRDNRNDYANSRFEGKRDDSHNQGRWAECGSSYGPQGQDRNFTYIDMRRDGSGYVSKSRYDSLDGELSSTPNQRKWNESEENRNLRFGSQEGVSGRPSNHGRYPGYKSDAQNFEMRERGREVELDYFRSSKYDPPGKDSDYPSNKDRWNEPGSYSSSKPGGHSSEKNCSFNKGSEYFSNQRYSPPPNKERAYPEREMYDYRTRPNQGFRTESRDFLREGGYRDENRGDFPPARNDSFGQNPDRSFALTKNDSSRQNWDSSVSRDQEYPHRPYRSKDPYTGSIKRSFDFDNDPREHPPKKWQASDYSGERQEQYSSKFSSHDIQEDSRIGSDMKCEPKKPDDSQQPLYDDVKSSEEYDEHSEADEENSKASDTDDHEDSDDDYFNESQNEDEADLAGTNKIKKIEKKQERDKRSIVSKIGTVGIAPYGFPKFNSFSREQAEEVKRIIISKIEELIPSDDISPRFSRCNYRVGMLIVSCLDSHTRQWLIRTMDDLFLRDGTQIRVCSPRYARNTAIVCGNFPTDYHGEEALLKILAAENPRIDSSRWTVLQQFPLQGGTCVSFGAPKSAVGDIHSVKNTVFFYSKPVKMAILSKKNSGRKAPKYQMRKFIENTVLGLDHNNIF